MELYNFIFNTRTGMALLILGGMVLFAILAFVFERSTRKRYRDRPAPDDEDDDL